MTVTFVQMSGNDLVRKISEDGSYDVYDRLKYLDSAEAYKETHYLAVIDDVFVGSMAVQPNPFREGDLWMKHVVVDPRHQNQGISSGLIAYALDRLASDFPNVSSMELSSFTDEGKERIKAVFERNLDKISGWQVRLGRADTQEGLTLDQNRDNLSSP